MQTSAWRLGWRTMWRDLRAGELRLLLVAGLISVVVLIMGATSVFTELQSALDRIWHIPPSEKPQGLWALLQARILSDWTSSTGREKVRAPVAGTAGESRS